jgi:undecaprenyl-diphosphatase
MPPRSAHPDPAGWRGEASSLDLAVYAAVAATPTPKLDRAFRRLSSAADLSKLWLGGAALLALGGGSTGRRAAVNGLAATAVTSAVVNAVLKPVSGRRRPDREAHDVPSGRQIRMPISRSFPSGHAASAFAFSTGVATTSPEAAIPLTALAALVAYSRVHTGVHYPIDVLAGAIVGVTLAPVSVAALQRRAARRAA